MPDKINYNYIAQSGRAPVDDMEVVNALGLDPAVAYTKDINKAALDKAHRQSYDGHIERGATPEEAKKNADLARDEVLKQIKGVEADMKVKLL
jgi:hypothetical protein